MKKPHVKNAHKVLRKLNKGFISFTNSNGTTTLLNVTKHLILNEPYKNQEYQKAMIDYAKRQQKMMKQREMLDKENQKEDNIKNKEEG